MNNNFDWWLQILQNLNHTAWNNIPFYESLVSVESTHTVHTRNAVVTWLCLNKYKRRGSVLWYLNKDMVDMIAKKIWESRCDLSWNRVDIIFAIIKDKKSKQIEKRRKHFRNLRANDRHIPTVVKQKCIKSKLNTKQPRHNLDTNNRKYKY